MKIWFQILASETRAAAFHEAIQAQVNRAADPGTTVEVHGTRFGGLGDNYKFFEHFDAREVIENVVKLRKSDYDAYVIGNSLDPSLIEAREMLNIPVLALTETSIAFAELMGEKFGMITVNRKFESSYRALIVRYRQEARLAGILPLEFTHIPDIEKMFVDKDVQDRAIDQFRDLARKLIAQGAEVIIPLGPMTTVLPMRDVHDVDGVAILDGYTLLIKMAEAAVKLQRLGQPVVSRALLYASPPDRLIEQADAAYHIGL